MRWSLERHKKEKHTRNLSLLPLLSIISIAVEMSQHFVISCHASFVLHSYTVSTRSIHVSKEFYKHSFIPGEQSYPQKSLSVCSTNFDFSLTVMSNTKTLPDPVSFSKRFRMGPPPQKQLGHLNRMKRIEKLDNFVP